MSSHNTSLCRFVVFEILYFTSSYCFAIIVIIDVIFFYHRNYSGSIIEGFLKTLSIYQVFILFCSC